MMNDMDMYDDYEKQCMANDQQMIALLQQIAQGIAALGQAMQYVGRPKRVVRDSSGKALGVE